MALQLKKIDHSKNSEAQWCKFDDETEALIMPMDNAAYSIALARALRKQARADSLFADDQVGVLDGEQTEAETIRKLTAQFLLMDWKGATDEAGKPLAYNSAVGALMLESSPGFMSFVRKQAFRIARENAEELEDVKGKSESGTSGSASQAVTTTA